MRCDYALGHPSERPQGMIEKKSQADATRIADRSRPGFVGQRLGSVFRCCLWGLIAIAGTRVSVAQEETAQAEALKPRTFRAQDSLNVGAEPNADARECLRGLVWQPTGFDVQLATASDRNGDFVVTFPSPRPTGNAVTDRVTVEWYQARKRKGARIERARAVVVVHELGANMAAGRAVARSFTKAGMHAFMIQLPSYGKRRVRRLRAAEMLTPMKQAIADVRRARDAIAVLPGVDTSHIALQGTSLGGIVAASTGSLDNGFDSVHLLLAGGDLFSVIKNGERDTAVVRRDLELSGVTDEQVKAMTNEIEPNRIAHRLNPDRTWLYSAKHDKVIPKANSDSLAKAAKLGDDHHPKFSANHYSGILLMPFIVAKMADSSRKLAESDLKTAAQLEAAGQ